MDKLQEIFEHQEKLTHQFHIIEMNNGLNDYGSIPFELIDRHAQKQLRTCAWYIVEECAEVIMESHNEFSELADVAHFVVELLICSGVKPEELLNFQSSDTLDYIFKVIAARPILSRTESMNRFVCSLGWAMHCLRNKPWKSTPKTDALLPYKTRLIHTFYDFIQLTVAYGMSSDSLYKFYMGKAAINQKRIDNKE